MVKALRSIFALYSVLLLSAANSLAQDKHAFQWRYESEFSGEMRNLDLLTLPDRGYLCAGHIEKPASSGLMYPYVYRVDCTGKVVWGKIFNEVTEGANNTSARVLQIAPENFVLVTNVGFFFTTPRNDIFISRMDGKGNVIWAKRYGGGTQNQDVAQSAIVTSDGSIVVAGQTGSYGMDKNSGNTYTDQYFMKVDGNGNILWTRTLGNAAKTDRAFDIVETKDGSLVAAGSYIHTGNTFYANLLKMDKNGNVLWNKGYGEGTVPQANHAYGVLQSSDGGYLITGSTTNAQQNFNSWSDFLVIKTDAEGKPEWTRAVSGGGPDYFENASNAMQKANGDFAIACATSSYPSNGIVPNKHAVITMSPTGNLVKAQTYNAGSSHYPRLQRDPYEGSYLLTGFSNWVSYGGNGNRFDPILINMDAEMNVSCFSANHTALTLVTNPPFDFSSNLPGTANSGGVVVNDLINVSNFEPKYDNVCEINAYAECAFMVDAEEPAAINDFSVFPNPAHADNPITLSWEDADVERVHITDVLGRLVAVYRPVPGLRNIEARISRPGIYQVSLVAKGQRRVTQIVVN